MEWNFVWYSSRKSWTEDEGMKEPLSDMQLEWMRNGPPDRFTTKLGWSLISQDFDFEIQNASILSYGPTRLQNDLQQKITLDNILSWLQRRLEVAKWPSG